MIGVVTSPQHTTHRPQLSSPSSHPTLKPENACLPLNFTANLKLLNFLIYM